VTISVHSWEKRNGLDVCKKCGDARDVLRVGPRWCPGTREDRQGSVTTATMALLEAMKRKRGVGWNCGRGRDCGRCDECVADAAIDQAEAVLRMHINIQAMCDND
jgi:hypothetical protein